MIDDQILISGRYRGVALHAGQNPRRLDIVRRDVDAAFAREEAKDMMVFLRDGRHAPESRIFAAAKLRAMFEASVDHRETRPADVDPDLVTALVSPLESLRWRSPTHYGSDLDLTPCVRGDPLDEPIVE
jgi:hypothetical protein